MRRVGVLSVWPAEMAVHRRPQGEGPPLELQVFRGDDWISDDGVPALER